MDFVVIFVIMTKAHENMSKRLIALMDIVKPGHVVMFAEPRNYTSNAHAIQKRKHIWNFAKLP